MDSCNRPLESRNAGVTKSLGFLESHLQCSPMPLTRHQRLQVRLPAQVYKRKLRQLGP